MLNSFCKITDDDIRYAKSDDSDFKEAENSSGSDVRSGFEETE